MRAPATSMGGPGSHSMTPRVDQDTGAGSSARRPQAPGYGRILVLFDGSPEAWIGIHQAIGLAEKRRSAIEVVSIVNSRSWWWIFVGASGAPILPDTLLQEQLLEVETRLGEVREIFPDDLSITTRILLGKPRRMIRRHLRSGNFELLVICPKMRRLGGGQSIRGLRTHSSLLVVRPISTNAG